MNLTEIIQSKNQGKTLSKIDEMRYNFITQRLDEEVYKGYIIAYHRTKDARAFMDISNKIGFSTMGKGGGDMYGVGFYGNYTWEGVNTNYSKSTYGKYVLKYIVKPNNIIFFDEYTQLKVYGKTMSIIEQCNYWGIELDNSTKNNIKIFEDEITQNKSKYTSKIALNFYKNILSIHDKDVTSQFYGISYNGHNDQDTILMYDFRNLSVLGYYDDKNVFHKIEEHNFYNIKTVSKNIQANTNINNLVTSKKQDNLHEQEILFNKTHDIKKNKTKYINDFLSDFFSKSFNFKIRNGEVEFKSTNDNCNFNGIRFETIPFQFSSAYSYGVIISNCDFINLSFMFKNINRYLQIDHCFKLVTLEGLQNTSFFPSNMDASSIVKLENLPVLKSIEYLPSNTRHLYLRDNALIDLKPLVKYVDIVSLNVNNCPNIRLNDGLPPNLESLIYTNKSDTDIDIKLLNKHPNLTYADINDKVFSRRSTNEYFSRS